jgi:hypothetical protein
MADRFEGVLRATIKMALAFRSPMTAREIAAHVTRLNPQRPFSGSDVISVLRAHPNLFVVESRRLLGIGPARWRLQPAAPTYQRPRVIQKPATRGQESHDPAPASPPARHPPQPREGVAIRKAPARDLDLIDDQLPAPSAGPAASADRRALIREIERRRAKRGRSPTTRPGQDNYRDVIDKNHPINRLSDETLNRMASNVDNDSE